MTERRSGQDRREQAFDMVERPKHYNLRVIECVELAELLCGNLFNALKYCWRVSHKWDDLEDLKKSAWYFRRHIQTDPELVLSDFASLDAQNRFVALAQVVLEHEPDGSLLGKVLLALSRSDGVTATWRRARAAQALDHVEAEIAALTATKG